MKNFKIGAIVLGMVAGTVQAEPVQWQVADGGNGHWYELVYDGNESCWGDAKIEAESQGGHLATITSQGEQDFLEANVFDSSVWMWIGGYQDLSDPDYSEPGGGWKWVTGEPMDYTHWYSGSWGEMPWDTNPPTHHSMQIGMTWWNLMWKTSVECGTESSAYVIEWNHDPSMIQWRIEDGGNGHWYKGVTASSGISWLEANSAAAEMGGYLATLTSADEDQFVCFTIAEPEELWVMKGTPRGPWLGGQRTEEDCDLQAMNWISGEPWNYTRWHSGNPNEDCTSGLQLWDYGVRDWQDNHDDDPTRANGYIVEFTTLPGSTFGACCLDGLCITTAAADCGGNSGSWGGPNSSCADFNCPENCPADVDGDGDVGVSDILMIIASWGACP